MAIAPLQLPGPLIVPHLDFSPLDKIGDAYVKKIETEQDAQAIGDALRAENERRIAENAKRAALTTPAAPITALPAQRYPAAVPGVRNVRDAYTSPSALKAEADAVNNPNGGWRPVDDGSLELAQSVINSGPPPPGGTTMGGRPGATAEEIIPGGGRATQLASLSGDTPVPSPPLPVSPRQPAQLPLGLKNNNPAYIPEGKVAQVLPGYKGAEGGFAAFETPDHGVDATKALLISFGRRGIKTGQEIVGQLPGMDPNKAEAYARFISPNYDPNATINLSDPAQVNQIAGKMGLFANDLHHSLGMTVPAAPPTQAQMAEAEKIMPPEMIKRVEALYRAGPGARALANMMVSNFIGKEQPIIIPRGGMAIHPQTHAVIASNPEARFDLRDLENQAGLKSGYVLDKNTGKVRPLTPEEMGIVQPTGETPPVPAGTLPRELAKKRSEEVAANEGQVVSDARLASNVKKDVDAALAAYERVTKAGGVGPIFGNEYGGRIPGKIFNTEAEKARQDYDLAVANLQAHANIFKGQGAVSNYERHLAAGVYPALTAGDPAEQKKYLTNLRDITDQTIAAGKGLMQGKQPGVILTRPPVVSGKTSPPAAAAEQAAAAAPGIPPQPPSVPPGSQYSPSRRIWRAPNGQLFDANGKPFT